jgi:hypothetical protein
LSTWLRVYLYVPLGGNRKGEVRTYVNPMLTMVLGGTAGAFLDRHASMRRESVLTTIDASPVGAALLAFMEQNPAGFEGSLTGLLAKLEVYRYRQTHEFWPRSPKGLGDALRRLSPALRLIGFECESLPKIGGAIRWHISARQTQSMDTCPADPGNPAAAGHAGHSGLGSMDGARRAHMSPH